MWKGLCYLDEDLSIINEVNGRPTTTLNLSLYYATNKAQRWVLHMSLEPKPIAPAAPNNEIGEAFATLLSANFDEILIVPMPQVVAQDPVSATATAVAGATIITASRNANLSVGRFIQFSNHPKIYIVRLSIRNRFDIYPPLHQGVSRAGIVVSPSLHCRQVNEVIGVTIRRKLISPRIRVAEVI